MLCDDLLRQLRCELAFLPPGGDAQQFLRATYIDQRQVARFGGRTHAPAADLAEAVRRARRLHPGAALSV